MEANKFIEIKNNVKFIIYDVTCSYGALTVIGFSKMPEGEERINQCLNKEKGYDFYIKDAENLFEDLDAQKLKELDEKFKECPYILCYDSERGNKDLESFFTKTQIEILFNSKEYDSSIVYEFFGKP